MDNKYFGKLNFSNKAKRVPICFCIDISESMDEIIEGEQYCRQTEQKIYADGREYGYLEPIDQNDPRVKTKADKLAEGLGNFYKAIKEDDMACDSCVSEIVTFRDTARVFEEFDYVENKRVPSFPRPRGNTNMTPALRMALDTLDEQKRLYNEKKIPYCQPWLVLFTDGQPTDDITRITDELIQRQKDGKLTVYICPLTGDPYAKEILRKLVNSSSNRGESEFVPCDNPKEIRKFFTFLAKSVSVVARGGAPKGFFDDASAEW